MRGRERRGRDERQVETIQDQSGDGVEKRMGAKETRGAESKEGVEAGQRLISDKHFG